MKNISKPELILRIGVAGEFIGHGIFALGVKQGWIPYFTALGFSEGFATTMLPLIGIMDLVIALFVLIKPIKLVLAWASLWGFWTALVRPLSGEPIWDFVERFSNWAAPLALLYMKGLPKIWKDLFKE